VDRLVSDYSSAVGAYEEAVKREALALRPSHFIFSAAKGGEVLAKLPSSPTSRYRHLVFRPRSLDYAKRSGIDFAGRG
jgi:hypothetical protein